MEKWGNGRARAYFEAQVPPGYARPSDWSNVHQMTKWIKDKYEYKRFLPKDGSVPGREPAPSRSGKPKLTTDQLLSMFMSPAASQPQHKPGPYGQPLAQPVNPTLAQQPSAYGTVPSHPQHHLHHYQQHHHPHHYHQQHQQQQQVMQPQYQQQRPQHYQQQSQQQYQQHQHQQHYQQERPSHPFGHTGSAGAPTPNPQPHPQPGRWGLETMSTPVTAIQNSQPQHGQGGFGGTASGMPGSMLPPSRPASLPPTGPGHALPSFPPSFPQQQPPWPAPSSQQQQPVWPPQPQQGGTGANGFAF
ncbi:stromal membrane-associated gtpase-activating protein [Nannochloropsis gaditana]|uniref:Stromal membrane-associated gtpase-activating protein n=1 Tax=Nannochloropsis gaditana TaxID=72520 RepID=W7TH24_9STRA|nr:stromal membrane-associated gtpase-activating protein [Nannochloropsis gaditana]